MLQTVKYLVNFASYSIIVYSNTNYVFYVSCINVFYVPFSLSSGHGVILEGAVLDVSRHVITDVNNRKVKCLFNRELQTVPQLRNVGYSAIMIIHLFKLLFRSLGSIKLKNKNKNKKTFQMNAVLLNFLFIRES